MIDWSKVKTAEQKAEEIRAAMFPDLTMRQFRLALLNANLLHLVDATIAGMPEPQKAAALIEWEYAATVKRDHPLVVDLSEALGMTEEQIDTMWIAAKAI